MICNASKDFFEPAQFLRIPHNQLPLLRLRTQATSYISTHLHLTHTHTYTPYVSCPPLKILGNEIHTLNCPHSSPLAQPAIQRLMFNLRQFDLWAWATCTDTLKVVMLLGSIPPKLYRQHEKANLENTSPLRVLCSVVIIMHDGFLLFSLSAKGYHLRLC